MPYSLEYVYTCHRGKVRSANQDNLLCGNRCLPAEHGSMESIAAGEATSEESPLFAVFDGMGGEEMGEMASCIAAETLRSWHLQGRKTPLTEAFMESNRRINRFTEEHHLNTCGTTAAVLLFDNAGAVRCDIGDSRIFRFRGGETERISVEDVYPSDGFRKPPLLQFLGIPESEMIIEPHTGCYTVQKGDCFLICSDGLTDMIGEGAIGEILRNPALIETGKTLLQAALDAGGKDNITFVLIRVREK